MRLYCKLHGVSLDLRPGRRDFTLDPGTYRVTDCALLHHPDPRPGRLPRSDRWGRLTDKYCEVTAI